MHHLAEILLDAVIDVAKMLPILFLVYLIIEYFEHKSGGLGGVLSKNRRLAPLMGAALGIFPQCGFSAALSDLYVKRYVTIGTLFAVLISTSDEAIPILMANSSHWLTILKLIGTKLVIAILFGYLLDMLIKKQPSGQGQTGKHHGCDCKGHFWKDALKHTAKISAYLFVSTLLINIIIHYAGKDNISNILNQNAYLRPFAASLVGLIPNCAASIIITELFVNGMLDFPSAVAGLCTGAGISLLVLFRYNKNFKENLLILLGIYFIGAFSGVFLKLIGF